MHRKGIVTQWDDERGFGFISPDGQTTKLFVHISAFAPGPRPQRGDGVFYTLGQGRDGRPAASAARIIGTAPQPVRMPTPNYFDRHAIRVWGACLLIVLLFVALIFDAIPLYLPPAYALVSVLSYLAYWRDKRAAQSGGRRIAEVHLHSLDLFGGVIGGLLAQQVLRHKTSKPAFVVTTGFIACLHGLALAALAAGLMDAEAVLARL